METGGSPHPWWQGALEPLTVMGGSMSVRMSLSSQETITASLDTYVPDRMFGKFWHFDPYFSSHIQENRGDKAGLCVEGHSDAPFLMTTWILARQLSSVWLLEHSCMLPDAWCHLGFLGKSAMKTTLSPHGDSGTNIIKRNPQYFEVSWPYIELLYMRLA